MRGFFMRIEVPVLVRIVCMTLVLCGGVVQAATLEVDYVTPAAGAPSVVSALLVTERPKDPADAPETPINSLEPASAAKQWRIATAGAR
jgi:hypothetical protein